MSAGILKTAHDAIICKRSAKGDATCAQSPLLDRFYSIRTLAIDRILLSTIYDLIQQSSTATPSIQLVILGAGLDNSYTRKIHDLFSSSGIHPQASISIYEVDFPDIINRRKGEATPTPIISDQVTSYLIACDLRETEKLILELKNHQFNAMAPTIFLVECVLDYISTNHVASLISLLSTIKPSMIISYDPIVTEHVSNGFAKMMVDRFAKRNAALLHAFESPILWEEFFGHHGWKYCKSSSLTAINAKLRLGIDANMMNPRIFDEYASLALLLRQYALSLACNDVMFKDSIEKNIDILFHDYQSHIIQAQHASIVQSLQQRLVDIENRLLVIEEKLHIEGKDPSSKQWHIRPASAADAKVVANLYLKCFQSVADAYSSVKKYTHKSSKALAMSLETRRDVHVVATAAVSNRGDIIGFAKMTTKEFIDDNTSDMMIIGELSHVCVDDGHRRQGIAKDLVSQLIASQSHMRFVDLTVIHEHEAARKLYSSMGFHVQSVSILADGCRMHHLRKQL